MNPNIAPSTFNDPQDHAHVQSLLAPYALSALDQTERALVDEHLASCESCIDELGELLETAAVIGLSDNPAPPESVWTGIENGMRAEQVRTGMNDTGATRVSNPTDLNEFRERKQKRLRSWRTAAVAAAAAAAITVPVTLSLVNPSTPTLAAMAAKASKAPGVRVVDMVGTDKERFGDVIIDPNGHGYARLDQLKPLPDGKTYQLWSVVDGQKISVGVLGRGPVTSVFTTDPSVQAVAITVEKSGGVVASTNTPVGAASFV